MANPTAPTLTSLNIPATVYLKGDNRTVTLTLAAKDNGDGIKEVEVRLSDSIVMVGPDGLSWASDTISFKNSVDSFSDGRSSLAWTLSSSTDSGTYSIVSIRLVGQTRGNDFTYDTEDLKANGVRTTFTVSDSVAPDPEPPPPPPPPPPPGTVVTDTGATLSDEMVNMFASGKGNVALTGNAFDNIMVGNAGKNVIRGGAGNDKLDGGLGNDTLFGEDGRDTFVFKTKLNKKTNVDKIADFKVVDDTIHLDNAIFKKLGKGSESKPGKLKKAFFAVATKAKDANDYVIYDKKKGVLFYDADGSGSGAATQFATIGKNLKMSIADFFVI
jgi:RTX calcium-binding nonapeptide repeat (4 copies)